MGSERKTVKTEFYLPKMLALITKSMKSPLTEMGRTVRMLK